ncbi:unnamed protein product [Amoebophrya sp. A25]|nr:unnamed protein product [Amoebophrya sp. A25]|eukprot:GSA25T00013733001.1
MIEHEDDRRLLPTRPVTGDVDFMRAVVERAEDVSLPPPILALHLKRGKAFLDHLNPEEYADCQLCVHFSFGSHDRKTAQPIFIFGVDCEWSQVLQWEVSRDEVLERQNLEAFHVTFFRLWADQRVDIICSQELRLREGNFVYELNGTEKKHKLIQGLVELEAQFLGAPWPLRPKINPDGSCEDWCSQRLRNDRLRKAFDDLDAFAENVHRHFKKRIDFYAENENGETYPLCHFVRPLAGGRCLDTPLHALRFVGLFPSKRDVLFEKRNCICYHSAEHIFTLNEASAVEKCLLLCGLFKHTWNMEAYVCLGTRASLFAAAAGSMRAGSKLSTLAGETEQFCFVLTRGVEEATIWDPLRSERYFASDPASRILSVDVAFNDEFIYVNPNEAYPGAGEYTSTAHHLSSSGASPDDDIIDGIGSKAGPEDPLHEEQQGIATEWGSKPSQLRKPSNAAAKSGSAPAAGGGGSATTQKVTKGAAPAIKRKQLLGYFNIRACWVEFRNPLPQKPPLEVKFGDRYLSSWNVVNTRFSGGGRTSGGGKKKTANSTKKKTTTTGTAEEAACGSSATSPPSTAPQSSDEDEDGLGAPIQPAPHPFLKKGSSKNNKEQKSVSSSAWLNSNRSRHDRSSSSSADNVMSRAQLLSTQLEVPAPLQRSTLGSGNVRNQQGYIEERIESVLRLQIERACGGPVPWDRAVEALLGLALTNSEQERVQLQSSAALTVFDEMAQVQFCGSDGKEEMLAFPIQFNNLSYEKFWPIMVENSTVQNMVVTYRNFSYDSQRPDHLPPRNTKHKARGAKPIMGEDASVSSTPSRVQFALRCKLFLYPENVVACWIMLAQKVRN